MRPCATSDALSEGARYPLGLAAQRLACSPCALRGTGTFPAGASHSRAPQCPDGQNPSCYQEATVQPSIRGALFQQPRRQCLPRDKRRGGTPSCKTSVSTDRSQTPPDGQIRVFCYSDQSSPYKGNCDGETLIYLTLRFKLFRAGLSLM